MNRQNTCRMPRILFSSPCGPYPKAPVDKDPVDFFYYRNTLGQGIFRLRSFQSWYSLHFLAQHLPVPSVVLENPGMKQFQREVVRGQYQVVAIGFTVITMVRVLAMVTWLRNAYPSIEIILGGYGTAVFRDPDADAMLLRGQADHICYGEGVQFMKQYLKVRWGIQQELPLKQDFLPMEHCFFRTPIPIFRQLVFVASLGCTFGCSFCSTSSQFGRRRISLASPRQLFEAILTQARRHPHIQSAIIYDEDFLMDRKRVVEFIHLMDGCPELRDRPLMLTVFASVRSLEQFSIQELIRCGIGTIYLGVESFEDDVLRREGLRKREGDILQWFDRLHKHGIHTLGSLIVGWDGQTGAEMRREAGRFVSLNPTFYQVVPLHPVPGTDLWKKLKEQGRLADGYTFREDTIGRYTFKLSHASADEALQCVTATYQGLVEEGGPWPFRVAENLMAGYHHLRSSEDPVMKERAMAYRRLCRSVMPLAILGRVFFRGAGFRRRWNELMRMVMGNHPLLFAGSFLTALAVFPLLVTMYGLANTLYWIRPHGDQPRFVRREYAGAGLDADVRPSSTAAVETADKATPAFEGILEG